MQHADETKVANEVACDCLLTRARLISRVLSRVYDDVLRPFGTNGAQFSLLVMISLLGPVSRADVGRYARLDRSTLTRNLRLLAASGWIEETRRSGGVARPIALTARGRRLLVDAAPAWRRAQAEAESMLGAAATKTLRRVGDGWMNEPAAW